jgi:glutaredoxin
MSDHVFVIYSKPGCPWCVRVEEVLSTAGLTHVVYKLNENFTPEEFYDEFGQGSTFPQVIMNGKHLGGCMDTVKYLQENKII